MFVVKSLSFRRKNYYSMDVNHLGPLEGEMELLNSNKNSLTMQLSAEQTQRILGVISEALVDTAKEAGQLITAQVMEQITSTQVPGRIE